MWNPGEEEEESGRRVLRPPYNSIQTSKPLYLRQLFTLQPLRSTRSSSLVTLLPAPVESRLKFSTRAFSYAAPHLWNTLPSDIRKPSTQSSDVVNNPLLIYLPPFHLRDVVPSPKSRSLPLSLRLKRKGKEEEVEGRRNLAPPTANSWLRRCSLQALPYLFRTTLNTRQCNFNIIGLIVLMLRISLAAYASPTQFSAPCWIEPSELYPGHKTTWHGVRCTYQSRIGPCHFWNYADIYYRSRDMDRDMGHVLVCACEVELSIPAAARRRDLTQS
jgi:hypothetical protein